ncbi:protein associated with UVRAG as autophagy enhancer isoform X1 [Embiotoca jacksoni]|uniref:protein associated with UVRAG as autophagy enhancer isoform X1 n=1 Tax=Embiotoca jacksoni TaxID=100190 RepID=UPI0037042A89
MMRSCSGVPSSLCRTRYVSWCLDPEDTPAPPTAALTVTAEDVSHQNQQSAAAGSIPLFLLSPSDTGGREVNTTFSHQHPQKTSTKKRHHKAFVHSRSTLRNTFKATNSHSDEGEDDEGEEGDLRPAEADSKASLLRPEEGNVHLPRSSPIISRHRRLISWHAEAPDPPDPSRSDSPSPSSGLLSLDQHGGPVATGMEDLGSRQSSCQRSAQVEEKRHCISISSNLNRLLSSLTGHYVSHGGQQGLAEELRQRGPTSCDAPHAPGLSALTQHSKERRSSRIPDFSADIFKTSCELEKENAHFILVDMVLEVLEGAKWTLSFDRWTSMMEKHRHTQCKTCTQSCTISARDRPQKQTHTRDCSGGDPERESHKLRHSHEDMKTSLTDTHSRNTQQHTRGKEEKDAGNDETQHQKNTLSVLSTDSGFEDCGVDTTLMPRDSLKNAEMLAQQLVVEFRRSWLPSHEPRRGRQSLRSSLQELPGTGGVEVSSSSLTEEIRLRTRMRGSLNWAPPRFQIIFTLHPTHRRSEVVALQHFLCAGCGTEIEPRYIKKLLYCEYLGRYFCDCCHSGSEALIPARVLSCWDFGKYPVSDFSKQLLDSVWLQPLFDLTCVGKTLYSRAKELDKFREVQEQLLGIKKLLTACRLSGRVVAEFEQLPAHLMEQPHLFSMDDFLKVKKGQLVTQARALVHSAIGHVENCELCLARGFICEFCKKKDIIFPFQSDICKRCTVCKTCYHKHCFVEKKCLKCARIQSRKQRSKTCDN